MTERLLQLIGLPAAVIGTVALTWDSITGIDLIPRLIATMILAAAAQELLARALANPDTPTRNPIGFGRQHDDEPQPRRSWAIGSIAALALAALAFTGLAWFQTERLVVSAARGEQAGEQTLKLTAAWVSARSLVLPLPPAPVACHISESGASLTEIDWEQPSRLLRIDDFVAPQSVMIRCSTASLLGQRGVRIEGPADGPYFAADLRLFKILIIVGGALIWVYGLMRLRARSS